MNKFEAKDIEIGGKVYAVTKDGGIFMHSYTDRAGKIRKNKWLTLRINKASKGNRECWQVKLTNSEGKGTFKYVHQIVMMAWGTPAPDTEQDWTIDHIDENSLNNHIDNLQWMTRSDNIKKSLTSGKRAENLFWLKAPNHQNKP